MSAKQMFSAVEGARLRLEPFTEADITPEYISWLNDREIMKYSNQRFQRHSTESGRRYCASFEGTENIFIRIGQNPDGACIGTMTVYVSPHHATADVGILIGRQSARGCGMGSEAWGLLLDWLLSQSTVRKVTAGAMLCNLPMVRLMERSGMTREAVRPAQELLDGIPQDLVYYGRFNDRWPG